ncbi:MAG: CBS domain-containing protein [Pseudomonadota bacterium]|nr:CBS domain-containing protein [Pseudomonadota bacterium]
MTIGAICSREVVITERDTPVSELARLMREQRVGSVVITHFDGNGNTPIGLVTDRDIAISIVADGIDPEEVTAGDLCRQPLVNALESEPIGDVLKRMRQHGVRRVPVVNKPGHLIGIVAVDDVLDLLASELSDLAAVLVQEQRNEAIKVG